MLFIFFVRRCARSLLFHIVFLNFFINKGYIGIGPGKEQQADKRKDVKLTPYGKC